MPVLQTGHKGLLKSLQAFCKKSLKACGPCETNFWKKHYLSAAVAFFMSFIIMSLGSPDLRGMGGAPSS